MKVNNLKLQAKLTQALGNSANISAKRGMASFYVVIFAMLVFIVLVLTFINLMLSESLQSSGSDFSASALDSAQAGVEDAKTAVLKCLKENGGNLDSCTTLFSGTCDSLSLYLYGETGEMMVGEEDLNQAYTCVILSQTVESLKSTLSPSGSDGSLFIIPLYKAQGLASVQLSWYSEEEQQVSGTQLGTAGTFLSAGDQLGYMPIVSVQMVSADMTDTATAINTATDRGVAVLVPTGDGATSGSLSLGSATKLGSTLIKKDLSESGTMNNAVAVKCSAGSGSACDYQITGDIGQVQYLVITNPYNDREVSMEVTALDSSGNAIAFTGVQVEVDSTGRASNYYRRIETRLSLANSDVPVPIYALNLGGDGDSDALSKNFASTRNCWKVTSGTLSTCDNGKSL